MMVVEASGISDIGKKRDSNEDAFLLDDDLRFYIVADGMGGHLAGEVASAVVVRSLSDYLRNCREETGGAEEAIEDTPCVADPTLSPEANRLLAGIHLANRRVLEQAQTRDAWRGMGSTVSAVLFTDQGVIAVNVGDSPIWLVHDKRIEVLSVAHTALSEGLIPAGGEDMERFGKLLTRAMGAADTVRADICEAQCFTDDVVVIGSDGLSNHVLPHEIMEVVSREDPAAACRLLVDLANQRAGDDNITVVVIKVKDTGRRAGGWQRLPVLIGAVLRRLGWRA